MTRSSPTTKGSPREADQGDGDLPRKAPGAGSAKSAAPLVAPKGPVAPPEMGDAYGGPASQALDQGEKVASGPAVKNSGEIMPKWLRSPSAMWILTLFPLICIALAGFNVARFYDLWINGWEGIAIFSGVGLGLKQGKDTLIGVAQAKGPTK